jgi:hypothetical protein
MIRWRRTKPIDISYIQKTEEHLGIKFPLYTMRLEKQQWYSYAILL